MGRFYNTGKGDYIDFIYKQPKNLLLQAVKTAEAQIDEQAKMNADLYGRLQSEALEADVNRRNQILADYRSQIDATAQDIMDNPLAYRGSSQKIRKLSDDISQNLLRGELAAIKSNVDLRNNYKEKLDAQVKAKEITRAEATWNLNKYDQDFKGTDYEGPTSYEQYNVGYFAPKINIFDKIDKRGAGWKADKQERGGWNFKYDQNQDRYIVTSKISGETISEKELLESFQDYVLKDNEIQDYYKTRVAPGYFTQEQMLNELSSAIAYGVKKYGYTKSSQIYDYKSDPLAAGKASRRAANMQPIVGYNVGTNTYQTRTIGDDKEVANKNEDINLQEKNILDLGTEAIERKWVHNINKNAIKTEQGWIDKNTKEPVVIDDEQLKQIEQEIDNFAGAIDRGNDTGDYTHLIDVVKNMNDNVKYAVDQLSKTNTNRVAEVRTNNSVVRQSVIDKLASVTPNWKNLNDKEKAFLIDALTNDVGNVKSNIHLSSNIPIPQIGPYSDLNAGSIIEAGKELVKDMQLFTSDGVVIPMSRNPENGKIELGGNPEQEKYAAAINDLIAAGAINFTQAVVESEISEVTVPEPVLDPITKKYEQKPVTKKKVIPVKLADGKRIQLTTTDEPLLNTDSPIPGFPGDEAKFLHKFIITDDKGKATEVYIAQSSNNFNFGVTAGKPDDSKLVNNLLNAPSVEKSERKIAQNISEGLQVASKFKKKKISTPGSDKYTMYNDGTTEITWNSSDGKINYFIDDEMIAIPNRYVGNAKAIKTTLITKVKDRLNNSGIK